MLTVTSARAAGLTVLGILIAGMPSEPNAAERTNPAVIERLTGVPVLGCPPHDPNIREEFHDPGGTAEWMAASGTARRVASRVNLAAGERANRENP